MLYPQKGSIAIGSRRTTPTAPVAAAVVSEARVAPRNVPCCQSKALAGTGSSWPSHHSVPSDRSATFVKIVSLCTVFIALGLVLDPVPGATPKKPASGLIAHNLPSEPTLSQD